MKDNKLLLYNANYYTDNSFQKASIMINDGRISNIFEAINLDEISKDVRVINCDSIALIPGFIDSHLHLPGDYLYRYFGLNLTTKHSFEEYIQSIKDIKGKNLDIIRGYGWNQYVLDGEGIDGFRKIKQLIDDLFASEPFILYSDDYHSCICNQYLLDRYSPVGNYDYSLDELGLMLEEDIFEIQRQLKELTFTNEEIREAILKYQSMLLANGITGVQTLMFLGGDDRREWEVLKELDKEKQLLIDVNLALTVHPTDSRDELLNRFAWLKSFESEKIRVNTIKIYIDGVVENKTALLSKPYENSSNIGNYLWEDNDLFELCRLIDKNNIQIHSHAIGDLGVHLIVKALCSAMDMNNSKKRNRHVITHLQIVNDSDIKLMGEYGIIANVQPYWIPIGGYYPLDEKYIGDRVEDEYKVNSFFRNHVIVSASSDSPVTTYPYPIYGISNAIFRSNPRERATWTDMMNAFTYNGAYQLAREHEIGLIKEGYLANLTLLSNTPNIDNMEAFESTKVIMTLIDGKPVYQSLSHPPTL